MKSSHRFLNLWIIIIALSLHVIFVHWLEIDLKWNCNTNYYSANCYWRYKLVYFIKKVQWQPGNYWYTYRNLETSTGLNLFYVYMLPYSQKFIITSFVKNVCRSRLFLDSNTLACEWMANSLNSLPTEPRRSKKYPARLEEFRQVHLMTCSNFPGERHTFLTNDVKINFSVIGMMYT